MEDVSLVHEGFLSRSDLYTVRVGELVSDNIQLKLTVTDKEFIKIKEKKEGRGCIHYNEKAKACSIYAHRPIQCRALTCWDEGEFMRIYAGPKASRRDIIFDKALLALMAEHDKRCSYMELDTYVRQIEKEGEKAVEKILELLKFDYHIRTFISKKLTAKSGHLGLVLGRPLNETITMFGLKVIRESDGSFFLTQS
jgi:Fe-S-cluster containining protein